MNKVIDFLTDNINVVIVVAGLIAAWVQNRRRAKEGLPPLDEEGNPEGSPQNSDTLQGGDSEEEMRARRIREEMQRKREQRAAGTQGQPAPATPSSARRYDMPPPIHQDPMAEMMKELAKRMAPPAPPPIPVQAEPLIDQAALARQRELEEKYRALQAEKVGTERRARAILTENQNTALEAAEASAQPLAELRDPANARRAIIYAEVFGKPVCAR